MMDNDEIKRSADDKDLIDKLISWIEGRNSKAVKTDLIDVVEISEEDIIGYIFVDNSFDDLIEIEGDLTIPFSAYATIGRALAYLTIYDISEIYVVATSSELIKVIGDAIRYLLLPVGLIGVKGDKFVLYQEPLAGEW